ncbi:PREDICTED: uncharacterized protein LOC106149898 [Chinchilla lanigera]|uniref:uncharacterized protein LOC106149898 n=1 Tax=Chinchilla lanigera TaxID=34839 RepID=UPI000696250A|nr:PREDICTED: uncharacterized protein LOC106149898 [Chinchilla lanigera]
MVPPHVLLLSHLICQGSQPWCLPQGGVRQGLGPRSLASLAVSAFPAASLLAVPAAPTPARTQPALGPAACLPRGGRQTGRATFPPSSPPALPGESDQLPPTPRDLLAAKGQPGRTQRGWRDTVLGSLSRRVGKLNLTPGKAHSPGSELGARPLLSTSLLQASPSPGSWQRPEWACPGVRGWQVARGSWRGSKTGHGRPDNISSVDVNNKRRLREPLPRTLGFPLDARLGRVWSFLPPGPALAAVRPQPLSLRGLHSLTTLAAQGCSVPARKARAVARACLKAEEEALCPGLAAPYCPCLGPALCFTLAEARETLASPSAALPAAGASGNKTRGPHCVVLDGLPWSAESLGSRAT